MLPIQKKLQHKLQQSHEILLIIFIGLSAMMTYFCMYAYRKPFSVATYEGVESVFSALDYKTLLVVSQVAGYALSKFIGIKIISEMTAVKRGVSLLLMIGLAQFALVAFALLPAPWNVLAIFCNGLPLGMIWGLVFGYLEGRKVTEALGVILGVSLIFSSGVVKSIGRYLLIEWQVPEFWMPATIGLLFSPLLLLSVLGLSCVPAPSLADMALRQQRIPLNRQQRWAFFKDYAPGLTLLVACYILLTSLREFIDNFSVEIFTAMGYADSSIIYTSTILPVTLAVLFSMLLMMFIKNNLYALQINLLMVSCGFAMLIFSTLVFEWQWISGISWMVLVQMGIYFGFMPFNCTLFDRLVAATPNLANAGFLMYIADSGGYVGSISIMLYRALFESELQWLDFVLHISFVAGIIGFSAMLLAMTFFELRLGQGLPVKLRKKNKQWVE